MKINQTKQGRLFIGLCPKRKFKSKKTAKAYMKKLKKVGKTKMRSIYLCYKCSSFHLSHLSKKQYAQKQIDYKLMSLLKKDLSMGES